MSRILVTGGAGCIGSVLVPVLMKFVPQGVVIGKFMVGECTLNDFSGFAYF